MKDVILNFKIKLKPIVKFIFGKKIRGFIISINNKHNENIFKKAALKYYNKIGLENLDSEKKEVLEYLKHNKFNLFPYNFVNDYKSSDAKISIDEKTGLKYSLLDNKKIFFKRSCTIDEAKRIVTMLILVQDIRSPHRYLTEDFNVQEGDIIADLGSAEGDFSLSVIDKIKKVYLFETDPELIEALEKTFEPWKEKIEIVNKYVSDNNRGDNITLDEFFKDKELPTLIKVDIEGAEYNFIQGAKTILSKPDNLKILLATYHKHNDEIILNDELNKFNFKTEYSKGYMLSIWDNLIKEPYLRRALIRGKK